MTPNGERMLARARMQAEQLRSQTGRTPLLQQPLPMNEDEARAAHEQTRQGLLALMAKLDELKAQVATTFNGLFGELAKMENKITAPPMPTSKVVTVEDLRFGKDGQVVGGTIKTRPR